MDWKYKYFHQQRVFPASRDVVQDAARTFMGESLGWKITESSEGFTAEGSSFAHRAIANVRFQSTPGQSSLSSCRLSAAAPLGSCCSTWAVTTTFKLASGLMAFSR